MIWGIFLLTSLGCLSYFTVRNIIEHYNYSVQTVYKFYYKDAIEFPSVTLCSACPIVLDKNKSDISIQAVMWSMSQWELTASRFETNKTLDYSFIERSIQKFGIDKESLFLQIKWNGEYLRPEDVVEEKILGPQDKCFVFNGKKYQTENGSYISDKSGMNAGLEMIVDVKQSYCPGGYLDTAGLKIYLHSAIDDQMNDALKAVIPPGTAAFIGLRKSKTLFLPYPYKAIGNKYCTEQQNYSKINCISQCVTAEIRRWCPCVPTLETEKNVAADCNNADILGSAECYREKTVELNHQAKNTDMCDCPDPCTLVEYETDVTYGYFPTQADSEKLVENGVVPDVKYARENILKFTMNYDKKLEYVIEYVPVNNPMTFIGTLGGHLGLFIGASIISILEFIELIVMSFWMTIVHICTWKKKPATTVKPLQN